MTGLDVDGESESALDSYAQKDEQEMFSWGNTANGELGLGGIEEQNITTPREVKFNKGNNIKSISCGSTHTLVLLESGEVYSCGNNDYGQLGHENSRTKLQLIESLASYKIISVACGEYHSLALDEWGQVFSWGADDFGQLGQNSGDGYIPKPKVVKSLIASVIVQIACGHKHNLALTNKGELFSWGLNDCGQLGLGLKIRIVAIPSLVASLGGLPIALIACGGYHSFILSKSGAVYGWGRNSFGQLGLNSEVDHIYPCQLKTLRSIRVKYVNCGEDFSVFLTQDGGVMTCGAGTYGQLGHGTTASEVLPRKVIELMGSTVTQIACGRRHTLAFVSSRERVYAFGLGSTGQLGTKQLINSTGPVVVQGPWLNGKVFVEAIFSGGDHCFVTVSSKKRAADYRIYPPESNIWTITPEKMTECENIPEGQTVDQDLLTYLETVLGSQASINGSFLLPRDQHYCCTSRHHGVDINTAQACFTSISRANNSIRDVCLNAISNVIPQLAPSPPDVETLRIYLTLPLYHEFDNARHSEKIQGPFAESMLNLKLEASKIVGNWYYMGTEEYFERLVTVYKNIVLRILTSSPFTDPRDDWDLSARGKTLKNSLDFLAQLNKLNCSKSVKPKVNYEIFHISELPDMVNIQADYIRWAQQDGIGKSVISKKKFCDYPFLFDAQAKTVLLQTDQTIQMHFAMNEATQRIVTQMLFSPVVFPVNPILELHVSRDNLVQDTIRELSSYSERDFKKPLRVHFLGEEAEDGGGVRKEFFLLLLREILDPKYGMFKSDQESNCIWFSEESFEDETMYYLVGLICGLAIYNYTIINLPFPLALYKKLLGEPVDLEDLRVLSPSLANGLQSLLNYEENDIEDVFSLRFEVTRDVYGEVRTTQLKPQGSDISVTHENKKEYVDLYIDYVLNKSVERHFRAFYDAFHKVCGGRVLQLFHAQELMAVVTGNQNYDWEALEESAIYKNGYSSSDKTIRLFWEVFHELPESEKRKFLLFLTGTDRIPIQGMKAVKITIQPTADDRFLPVAHTCFNLLDLPRYSTKERLRYKLSQAIQQTEGFSIV